MRSELVVRRRRRRRWSSWKLLSLRNLLREANQKIDEIQAELSHQRGRNRTLETDYSSLRNQVSSLRAQVSTANADGARLRKDLSDREAEIRQHLKTVSEKELHLKTFRNYLADTGIMVDEEEVAASGSGAPVRLYEIEAQLAERTRQQESLSRELQNARQQQQMAESQVMALKDELVHTKEQADGSSESDERVVELERRLAEAEATSKERLQIMEQDYRTAVMCVK
jgi:chromosome segregation ATPase